MKYGIKRGRGKTDTKSENVSCRSKYYDKTCSPPSIKYTHDK
jgi:hypothetical protein